MALLAEEQGSVQITAIIKSDLGLKQTNSLQKAETTEREMEKQRMKNIKVLAQGLKGWGTKPPWAARAIAGTYTDGTTNWNPWHSDMGHIYLSWPCYQRLWGNFLSVVFLMQLLYLVSHLVKEACSHGRGVWPTSLQVCVFYVHKSLHSQMAASACSLQGCTSQSSYWNWKKKKSQVLHGYIFPLTYLDSADMNSSH